MYNSNFRKSMKSERNWYNLSENKKKIGKIRTYVTEINASPVREFTKDVAIFHAVVFTSPAVVGFLIHMYYFQCCDFTIQTIDHVMSIEKEQFEPYLSGYLGNSLEEATQLQNKLQNFEPMAQVE